MIACVAPVLSFIKAVSDPLILARYCSSETNLFKIRLQASASATTDQEDEQSNKRPRIDEGTVAAAVETKVASEDEDSEPSSVEEDDD